MSKLMIFSFGVKMAQRSNFSALMTRSVVYSPFSSYSPVTRTQVSRS